MLALWLALVGCSGGPHRQAVRGSAAKPFFITFAPFAGPAVPLAGDGGVHVAYQLLLTSYVTKPLRLVAYRIKSDDPSCPDFAKQYQADALNAIFNGTGNPVRVAPQTPVIQPGQSAMLFAFLDLAAGRCIPSAFSNTLDMQQEDAIDTRQTLHGPDAVVSNIKAPVIRPPLRGKDWWTPNGPANGSIHRRTLIVLDGTVSFPEEYAVDWVQLGANGNTFSGDPHSNNSYFAYRSPIYTAANGTVVATKDGIPDNRPVQDEPLQPAVPITLDTIAGNYVIEDFGNGSFALYAHLIAGTLKVSKGQAVHSGDLLGELGNSGNSTEPHLHFQVMDGPASLKANGLPFVLDSWTRLNYEITHDAHNKSSGLLIKRSHPVTGQAFMSLDLGNF